MSENEREEVKIFREIHKKESASQVQIENKQPYYASILYLPYRDISAHVTADPADPIEETQLAEIGNECASQFSGFYFSGCDGNANCELYESVVNDINTDNEKNDDDGLYFKEHLFSHRDQPNIYVLRSEAALQPGRHYVWDQYFHADQTSKYILATFGVYISIRDARTRNEYLNSLQNIYLCAWSFNWYLPNFLLRNQINRIQVQ